MPYLANWFAGKPEEEGRWQTARPGNPAPPAGVTGPTGGTTPPPATGPAAPTSNLAGAQAGPGTGFVPLAAYFNPNKAGAQSLVNTAMEKFPGSYSSGGMNPAAPGYDPNRKVRTAQDQAEASSYLANMNPLDSFLTKQAGGQKLFDRLSQWAAPYTPTPPQEPDYGNLPFDHEQAARDAAAKREAERIAAERERYREIHGYYPGENPGRGGGIGGGGIGGGG